MNQLAEEWHRQLLAWRHLRCGRVVIFDRHFFADYFAHDIAQGANGTIDRRLHGLLLRRFYPKPDVVVFLDAPPEVLLARKGEGTLETLARRRDEYVELASVVEHFSVVDATLPIDEVIRQVREIVHAFAGTRSGPQRFDDSKS